jgi:hypothetical protein
MQLPTQNVSTQALERMFHFIVYPTISNHVVEPYTLESYRTSDAMQLFHQSNYYRHRLTFPAEMLSDAGRVG